MNIYNRFCNDDTIYAILQSLTPLNRDLKERIIIQVVLAIVDEYLLEIINEPFPDDIEYLLEIINDPFPDDIEDPPDMWHNLFDDDNEWWN